jgi:hypothetical protein
MAKIELLLGTSAQSANYSVRFRAIRVLDFPNRPRIVYRSKLCYPVAAILRVDHRRTPDPVCELSVSL